MSRSSFGFRRSFTSGRKISRDNRKNQQQGDSRSDNSEPHEKRQRSRHGNCDSDKATRSIFGDVPLTDTERRYLWAAQSGNLPALEMLMQEAGTFSLSCRDYLGRTALQLAVIGEHYDCIELLLEKSRLDVIEEGLLHAINTENVKICDMFLSHPVYSDQRARMQMEFQHGFYEQEDNSSSFAPDITPIVLAAQHNNFDIVHMLIQKGFTIPTPHNYFCLCTECYNHKIFDRVVHSKSRLNAYRGLASTAYLCLSCDDPIFAAFELSRSLQKLADREKEHKNEYKGLSDKCKNFAVDLLDHCRTNEEVMAALHGGTDTRDLARIKMAIRYEQKKFISHASCQEHLASMWYSGAAWFQHQDFPVKLVMVPFGILFIPVTAIIYVFLPYSRVGKILKSPFMKFMNYICSYTAFLVLLFLGTQLSSFRSSHLFLGTEGVVNGLIMFYVLGMFWAECKQLWEEGVQIYFSQMWNYMDITMLALYTAGYSTEAVIYRKTHGYANSLVHSADETVLNPQILSKVLFSVANVMSFARIAYILPASETFGQLQISYGRMLQDVGKFIFIYFTVMIAFICGLTSLYSITRNYNFAGLLETTGTLFWAAFGMGSSIAPKIFNDDDEENSNEGPVDHRPLEGRIIDKEHLAVIETVGYILYGVYILGAVVVLINMLIAMMSNTFEEIQKSEDCEWKFARAKLWISFIEQGTTLPIPFNIIPTPKSALKIIHLFRDWVCYSGTKQDSNWHNCQQYDQKYKTWASFQAIMHRVVLRYIHKMKFEKKGESLKDEILDTREEVVFQLHSIFGRLAARLELLENHVYVISKSGLVSQDGVVTAGHSSLAYSRSAPAHSRDGDRVCDVLSDQPRESYLQRRRSAYYVKPKRQMPEEAGTTNTNTNGTNSSTHQGNLATCLSDKVTREPGTSHTSDLTTEKTTHTGSDVRNKEDDSPPGGVERTLSAVCRTSRSLSSNNSDSTPVRCASCRLRPSLNSGSSPGGARRIRKEARVEQSNREEASRDSRARDGFSSTSRLAQSVIKESSLEDHMNTPEENEMSFFSRIHGINRKTESVKQRSEPSNQAQDDSLLPCRERMAHRKNSAEHYESQTITDGRGKDSVADSQQIAASTMNTKNTKTTSFADRFSKDMLDHPGKSQCSSTGMVKSKTVGVSLNSAVSDSTNPAHCGDMNNKDRFSLRHSKDAHSCFIHQATTSSNPISLENSKSVQKKLAEEKNISWNLPGPVVAGEPEFASRTSRRTGLGNDVYIPQSTGPGSTASTDHKQRRVSNEPVFYTQQSGYHRHSLSDLRRIDELSSCPDYYPGDGINQTRLEFGRSGNSKRLENLGKCTIVDTKDTSLNEEFHSGHHKLTTRLTASSQLNPGMVNSSLSSSREHLVSNPETAVRTRSPTEVNPDAPVSLRQYAKYSSYQRPSPLRKRDSAPMISLASRNACLQRLGPEDFPERSISSIIPGNQPIFTVFSSRYQHYPAGDLDLNTPTHGITSSVSMIIPTMAANLRPFPLPIQSYEDVSKAQPQLSPNTSDNEYSAGGNSSSKESLKRKSSRSKTSSIVSFVKGRRSNKGNKYETKHNRSYSMSRYHSGSANKKPGTLQAQRSKEV